MLAWPATAFARRRSFDPIRVDARHFAWSCRNVRLKRPASASAGGAVREESGTRRDSAGAPGRRRRTRRPTRAANVSTDPAPQRRRTEIARCRRARSRPPAIPPSMRARAFVLVLMQPHPAVGIVVVEDAEIRVDVMPPPRRKLASQGPKCFGQRRRRQAVEVRAGASYCRSCRSNDGPGITYGRASFRHPGRSARTPGRAVDERTALVHQRTLGVNREELLEKKGPGTISRTKTLNRVGRRWCLCRIQNSSTEHY